MRNSLIKIEIEDKATATTTTLLLFFMTSIEFIFLSNARLLRYFVTRSSYKKHRLYGYLKSTRTVYWKVRLDWTGLDYLKIFYVSSEFQMTH